MYDDTDHTGVFLSRKALMTLQPEARMAVLAAVFGEDGIPGLEQADDALGAPPALVAEAQSDMDDESFVEFSPRQARKYIAGLKEKTRPAAEAIARSDSRKFHVKDVATAVGVSAPELRGVWGGLTRRAKTISGDQDAYLVDWSKSEPVYDDNGKYIDQVGEVSEMTYQSLRKAFGL